MDIQQYNTFSESGGSLSLIFIQIKLIPMKNLFFIISLRKKSELYKCSCQEKKYGYR